MKNSLISATLMTVVTFCGLGHLAVAKNLQGKKSVGDFASRPAPPVSAEAKREMETQLAAARARYEANPNDPEAIIWFGRRLAYPSRFREAIEVYTKGIDKFPSDARLYRHRGHRYITSVSLHWRSTI